MSASTHSPEITAKSHDFEYEADPHEIERLDLTELARDIEADEIARKNLSALMWNYVGAPALDRRFNEGIPVMTRERMLPGGALEQANYTRELLNHISSNGDVLYIRGIDTEQDAEHPDAKQKYIVVAGNLFDEQGLTEYRTGGALDTTTGRRRELWLQLQRMKPGSLYEPKIMDTESHMKEWDGIRVVIDKEDVRAVNLVSEHAAFAELARESLIYGLVKDLRQELKAKYPTEGRSQRLQRRIDDLEEKHGIVLGNRAISTYTYETPDVAKKPLSRTQPAMEFYPLDHLNWIIQEDVDRQHLTLAA